MKRSIRYAGEDLDKQISNSADKVSSTENNAVEYKATRHPLLILNFMVPSLRNRSNGFIVRNFIKAYQESPKYAVKWLFYLRDILEGMGERRTFRICMKYLAKSHTEIAKAVMPPIPEYGRYDDLLVLLDTDLCNDVSDFMKKQLDKDLLAMKEGKPVSLLAKWLPSINTSSPEARKRSRFLANEFEMSEREYRKTLSALRAYGNVVEVKMSAAKWENINYESVPVKANLNYNTAFLKHDMDRRAEYLFRVFINDAKLKGNGIMPYEAVHRFLKTDRPYNPSLKDDFLGELMSAVHWQFILHNS